MRLCIAIMSAFLVLVGCAATPDLNKWAEGSATLSAAVAEENRKTLDQIDEAIGKLELGYKEGWSTLQNLGKIEKWKNHRQTYYESVAIINTGMEAMVKYANAVSDLAAVGETGKEASQKLIDSAKSIFETAGATFPGGSAVGKAVGAALQEIADIVTRVQAQDALADTMGQMDKAVNALSDKIEHYTQVQKEVVSVINNLKFATTLGEYGSNRIRWSERTNTYQKIEALFKEGDAEKTLATLELLDRETERMRAFEAQVMQTRKWRDESKQKLEEIVRAAKAWAKAHREAADLLKTCGGMRSLNPKCGTYTAANLIQAETRIRNVITAYSGSN